MKIRISDIQVGDRVFDAGSRTYVEVVQKTLHSKGVTITFADMLDTPMEAGGMITVDVQRAAPVVTDPLDRVLQHSVELDYAADVINDERALNVAIRALPANMYVLTTITEMDVGRNHKIPFITVTPCQEA